MSNEDFLFDGLKVLDVGSWIAGPVAATILADMGAEVIKIELPVIGDGYRQYGLAPMTPLSDVNYTWALDARNKRSLALNLKTDEGKAIIERLIADCDIYITNQPLPLRRQLGLTYEEIKPLNERMIYASLTPYGEQGPEKDKEAFDLVAYWSRSGLMDRMRHKGEEPIQSLAGMGDHPTSISMYAGIVTALLRRERTGKGGLVHTSLLANGVWSASCLAQAALAGADFSSMPGQRLTTALYQTSDDRWIQLNMVRNLQHLDALLVCLDSIELLTDERFATLEKRVENAAELTQALREVIVTRTAAEWMERFREAELPVALVGKFEDLATDPQVQINGITVKPVEDVGMDQVIRDPINVEGVARVGVKKAPDLGEHSREILAEMGFSDAEIDSLAERNVI